MKGICGWKCGNVPQSKLCRHWDFQSVAWNRAFWGNVKTWKSHCHGVFRRDFTPLHAIAFSCLIAPEYKMFKRLLNLIRKTWWNMTNRFHVWQFVYARQSVCMFIHTLWSTLAPAEASSAPSHAYTRSLQHTMLMDHSQGLGRSGQQG